MSILETLHTSDDPIIAWKAATLLADRPPSAAKEKAMRAAIARSPRVTALLSERDRKGRIPLHPYHKWRGAHWVLIDLADNGYPSGDTSLAPLVDQEFEWLLSEEHESHFLCIEGKWRRCASQEGNLLFALHRLGLADERSEVLFDRLQKMQWPDGGWNCRKDRDAAHSSYMESLTPMRGLIAHAKATGSRKAKSMAKAASEIFLKRHLYKKQSDGTVIRPEFVKLHYPNYWHYDILFALKVLQEGGFAKDARTRDALDLLESKRLPGGGFPAEAKYYQSSDKNRRSSASTNWGVTGKKSMNPYVTVDALSVLKNAGRTVEMA